MSYIGREPQIGNFQMCDAISVVNNQASYSMQVGGVAVIPGGNFNVIASVNGVVQKSGTSFTISSSTITFSQNLVTGDVIDFILILGSVLDLGVPSDGTVTTGKIADNAVTSAKLASGLALGKIGQVVYATYATSTSISSTTFADTGLSANITPSATSSKVLVMATIQGLWNRGTASTALEFKIFRGTTEIQHTVKTSNFISTGVTLIGTTVALNIVDSPSSSSELNYKIQFAGNNSDQNTINSNNDVSSITLMEVLA